MAVKTNYDKNGYKYYRLTKTIGHNEDGKPIKKEFYGKSRSEAEQLYNDFMSKSKQGLNMERISLGTLFNYWVYNVIQYSKMHKHSTFERYEIVYRVYVKNASIAGIIILDVKPIHIQQYFNSLYDNGKSHATIKELNKVLKIFFNWCIENDYILKNPCRSIAIPGDSDEDFEDVEEKYIDFFSQDEINKIQSNYKEDNTKYICMLGFGMGLRQGEILGLRKGRIKLDAGQIHINRTLSRRKLFKDNIYVGSELVLTTPKTKGSAEIVPIPQSLIIPLTRFLESVEKKYKENGLVFNDESLIFTTSTCKPIDANDFRRAWKRLLKRAGVEYKRFHCTRHTFASFLFREGISLKTVQVLLRHKSLSTTEKIYVHVMPEDKVAGIDKINKLFQN